MTGAPWLTVSVLFVLYILAIADRYIFALLTEPIKADLLLSDFQISLLQGAAFDAASAICAIPVGYALDRLDRRLVLFASVIVWSCAAVGCGLSRSFSALFAFRAGIGAGEAGLAPGSSSIIGDAFPPHSLAFAMSLFVMGGSVGAGLVFVGGGALISALEAHGPVIVPLVGSLVPWQQAFVVVGLAGVILSATVFLFPEPGRTAAGRPPRTAATAHLGAFLRPRVGLYTLIFFGFAASLAVSIAFQLWTPAYLARTHGWTPLRVGAIVGSAQVAAALIGLPLHGWCADRLYRAGYRSAHLMWTMATNVASLPFFVLAFAFLPPYPAMVAYCFGMMLILSSAVLGPTVIQIVTPSELRGRISSMFTVIGALVANTGGPALVGLVTDRVFQDGGMLGEAMLGTGFALVALACLLLLAAIYRMNDATWAGG